jgi:hypothetical protein
MFEKGHLIGTAAHDGIGYNLKVCKTNTIQVGKYRFAPEPNILSFVPQNQELRRAYHSAQKACYFLLMSYLKPVKVSLTKDD